MHWQNLFMKYDGWGNLVSRRSGLYEQHYEYDAENRLIKAEGNGPEGRFTAHYHYDGLGRRIRKNVTTQRGTTEARFLWQGYRLLQEQQHNGQCQTYIYDPDEAYSPLARVDHLADDKRGDMLWFSTDLNGAPMEVTDGYGELCWSGRYRSFGEVTRQTEGFCRLARQTALHHQPLRYAGQYADSETGLHYNLFRYYDPQTGRFTVQDPIGLAGGINLYSYAPNPLSWIDPLGLSGELIGSENNPFDSSRAARREAMRQAGIPTSQQPISQSKNSSGREYSYETPKPGGSTGLSSVQEQTMDISHPDKPHWEAGQVKIDDFGNSRMNKYGRPQLRNGKGKAYYGKGGCK